MHDELVESEALSAGGDDSGSSALGELEGGHGELWHFVKSLVVGDGGHSNNSSVSK